MYMYIHEVHVMVHISLIIAKISTLLNSNHLHCFWILAVNQLIRDYFISWFTRDKHVCDNLFLRARLINICFIINNNHTTISSSLHSWWRGSPKPCENFSHAIKRWFTIYSEVTLVIKYSNCKPFFFLFAVTSFCDQLGINWFTKTRFCDQWLPFSYNNARNICDDEAGTNLTKISCMRIFSVQL